GLELEARQPVRDRACTRKAVAVEVHAEEAELGDLLRELAREDALLEPLADVGNDPLPHEPADGVADRLLLVVEERVDGEEVAGVELGRLGGDRHAWMV